MLVRQLGEQTQGTGCWTQVGRWTTVLHDGQHTDTPAYTSWSQRVGRLSDRAQGDGTLEIYHISWPSLRQRKRYGVPQRWCAILNEVTGHRIDFGRADGGVTAEPTRRRRRCLELAEPRCTRETWKRPCIAGRVRS